MVDSGSGKSRERIDKLLVERGYFSSRNRAQAALMAGEVHVDGTLVDKAGKQVCVGAEIEVKSDRPPYVSRGGLKLEKALEFFDLDVSGWTVIDIGASTGGFTDCLLQNGARKVFAVDVGYGQLAYKLRRDPRVEVRERVNARYLQPSDFPLTFDMAVIDVSFISLTKVLPAVMELIKPGGKVVALVKPQFEAGPEKVGKGGVVKSRVVHREVLLGVLRFVTERGGWVDGIVPSPIRGAESGNIEFLLGFSAPYDCKHKDRPHLSSQHRERLQKMVEDAFSPLR